MTDYYVILTGSKNNAGDFLIKHRALELFNTIRPDRQIIDFNAWESLDADRLSIVNNAKALILMGGPSLQKNMYPGIYKLCPNLDDIKVPITTMGIGWKSINGEWQDTYNYPLSKSTLKLLNKIKESSIQASVRDFHTLQVMNNHGIEKVLMTGCAATYDNHYLYESISYPKKFNKIAFSLGVSFVTSNSMESSMKDLILTLKNFFDESIFEVVFHHSLNKSTFKTSYSGFDKHLDRHHAFLEWLMVNNIPYSDISGHANNLIQYYSNVDLHIGYRVHAHLFMTSISQPTILITEDGRGKSIEKVLNGNVIQGYSKYSQSYLSKIKSLLNFKRDYYDVNAHLCAEVTDCLKNEIANDFQKFRNSLSLRNNNFQLMNQFIRSLP